MCSLVAFTRRDSFEYDALDMVAKARVTGDRRARSEHQWRSYVYNASDERIGTIILSAQNTPDSSGRLHQIMRGFGAMKSDSER